MYSEEDNLLGAIFEFDLSSLLFKNRCCKLKSSHCYDYISQMVLSCLQRRRIWTDASEITKDEQRKENCKKKSSPIGKIGRWKEDQGILGIFFMWFGYRYSALPLVLAKLLEI